MSHPKCIEKYLFELFAVAIENTGRVLGENLHVAEVTVGSQVALETVGVAALFLAHLAVEFQLLKAFGLHAFAQIFE